MLNKNIETFIGCDAEYEDAAAVIFGAPFDSTTSFRPGTRFGCRAMRSDSFGLETYSPYQDRDLTDIAVFDSGDIELPFGNPQTALEMIEERADIILSDGKLPVMLGGEHLVTLGAVRAAWKKHPNLCIVHLDAHADLRNDYLGARLSHACVMRRCHDLLGDGRIYQLGIRSGAREEFEFAKQNHVEMHPFDLSAAGDIAKKLSGKPVYLTIDLDVLDPSIFPGTGTPEAGGATFTQLLTAISQLTGGGMNIVACDVNELSPAYDISGVSTAVACKVLRELLLSVVR